MKKIWIPLLAVLAVLLAGVAVMLLRVVSNPWEAQRLGDIPAPAGFERVAADSASYTAFLRDLPLKEKGSRVCLYNGKKARMQMISSAVVDLPLIHFYEQCADVTMRIRAEYLWSNGRYDEIRFTDMDGKEYAFGGKVTRKKFKAFMVKVFTHCNTASVYAETTPRAIRDIQPGDILVYASRKDGSLGHAVLVADVARDPSGRIAILCVEGNTPARSIHVVRNLNPFRNPWFFLDPDGEGIRLSFSHFKADELRHY